MSKPMLKDELDILNTALFPQQQQLDYTNSAFPQLQNLTVPLQCLHFGSICKFDNLY